MADVSVALIGAGGFAGVHARRLNEIPECEVVGVQDIVPNRAQQFADRWFAESPHKPTAFSDMKQMIEQKRPTAVVISTPHTLHFEHICLALDAGCHVLVEKPMVTNSEHAREIMRRAEEKSRIVCIGYNTPCTPALARLRHIIAEHELGPLQAASGWLSQDWKNLTMGTWRQDPGLSGGGQMYDSGAHLFNSLVWAVDEEPESVFAIADNSGTEVDINGVVTVRFRSGALANVMICGNCAVDGSGLDFCFEDGHVAIDGWGGGWIRIQKRGSHEPDDYGLGEPSNPDRNFIRSILGEEEPKTTPRHGLLQSLLMDAIYESAKTGQVANVTKV
ncbi:MAG: Glucose--fructose oxidoreductase [Fimbriimonadales bacterium]|nr:Glucose--fructose oxidoreductase [Fimbriimonadales bacterium]